MGKKPGLAGSTREIRKDKPGRRVPGFLASCMGVQPLTQFINLMGVGDWWLNSMGAALGLGTLLPLQSCSFWFYASPADWFMPCPPEWADS